MACPASRIALGVSLFRWVLDAYRRHEEEYTMAFVIAVMALVASRYQSRLHRMRLAQRSDRLIDADALASARMDDDGGWMPPRPAARDVY